MTLYARRLAAVAVALMLAGPAQAQKEPSPSHLQAARTVIMASGLERSLDAILPDIFQHVRQTFTTRPELAKDLEEVIQKAAPRFERAKEEIVDTAAKIFTSQLTEAELTDIGAFFNSSSGKRYVATQPVVIEQMYNELQEYQQTLSLVVINSIRAELEARGHKF